MNTNMRPLGAALLKSGILSNDALSEFRKWGVPIEQPNEAATFSALPDILEALEAALYSEGLVIERTTDVDLLRQYMLTVKTGHLHLEISHPGVENQTADFPVMFGKTPLGEYIIPWKGDSVEFELTNGLTYLLDSADRKIFFCSVREFFFDDQKAFMVCKPSE